MQEGKCAKDKQIQFQVFTQCHSNGKKRKERIQIPVMHFWQEQKQSNSNKRKGKKYILFCNKLLWIFDLQKEDWDGWECKQNISPGAKSQTQKS